MSRSTPRSLRAEATRERILEAAAQAFDRRGYLGVNLNEVVRELGLTKGALYYFFPTKEHLAAEIVRRHFGVWEPLAKQVLSEHDNLLDAMIDITYRVGRTYQTNCFARAGTRLSTERNLVNTELPEPFVGWLAMLTRLFETARERGQVRENVIPAAAAELMVSFFYGAQGISEYFTHRQDLLRRLDNFWKVVEPALRPDTPATGRPEDQENRGPPE
jgi:AcrR family transcriptional regulator